MAAISQEEKELLKKFRDAIQVAGMQFEGRQTTDMFLITWLRAREMNIPKAIGMLKKSYAWRKDEDIGNILAWKPPESYAKMFPYEICGRCNDKCPVIVIPFGKWDVRKTVEAGEKKEWLRQIDQMFAVTYEEMYKINDVAEPGVTPVSQCIIIVDFEGYGLRQLTSIMSVQTLLECVNRFEGNYPEILKKMYFINAPRAFSIFFSIIKPVMSATTLGKTEIFTNNQSKWKPAILTHVSPDQLPTAFGGTNPDSCKFLSKGFVFAYDPNDNSDEEFVTTTIAAGQEFKLEYDITKENTILGWTFKIDSYDIGFSVQHYGQGEVVPYKKYDSKTTKQDGSHKCKKSGTYTLIFDNKYSQFRGKTVHYSVNIIEPENSAQG